MHEKIWDLNIWTRFLVQGWKIKILQLPHIYIHTWDITYILSVSFSIIEISMNIVKKKPKTYDKEYFVIVLYSFDMFNGWSYCYHGYNKNTVKPSKLLASSTNLSLFFYILFSLIISQICFVSKQHLRQLPRITRPSYPFL